jgi:cbb3-type cytochrome oxidase maturation protein
MSVIYVLIPIAILLTALAIYLFFWAVKTDQFDDLEKQGFSILFDQDKAELSTVKNQQQAQQTNNEQISNTNTKTNTKTETKTKTNNTITNDTTIDNLEANSTEANSTEANSTEGSSTEGSSTEGRTAQGNNSINAVSSSLNNDVDNHDH